MRATRRVFLAVIACLCGPARARTDPVTPEGEKLRRFLDGSGVDHLWLPGFRVDWRNGAPVAVWPVDGKAHTHCSAFAASAAMTLGVYLLRPPEHGQNLLANAQMEWLRGPDAARRGWRKLDGVAAAQQDADRGQLVVAVFENPDTARPGHIAVLRPGPIPAGQLERDGPMVTQAGNHNATAVPLARGFAGHRGAWLPGGLGAIRFFSHDVAWGEIAGER